MVRTAGRAESVQAAGPTGRYLRSVLQGLRRPCLRDGWKDVVWCPITITPVPGASPLRAIALIGE